MAYDHKTTEKYWQDRWSEEGLYRSVVDWDRPKYYVDHAALPVG